MHDEELFYTVRLEVYFGNKNADQATGFWFRSSGDITYLICNKHTVIEEKTSQWATKLQFSVHQASTNNRPTRKKVLMVVEELEKTAIQHENNRVDLIAIPFACIQKKRDVPIFIKEISRWQIASRKILEKMCNAVEEVVYINT